MRLVWVLGVVLGVAIAGCVYQWVGGWRDRRCSMGRGELVDVGGGRRLYLSRKGLGGPAVIFESGIAATSLNWAEMQERVSEFACAVSYDRGGLGWSSECGSERTPGNIARELRTLLVRAGIGPPYVLVGHSFGGLVARKFAAEHAEEVVGVVLLDAMRTEDWPPVNAAQAASVERGMRLARIGMVAARFGLARVAMTSLLRRSGRLSRVLGRVGGGGGQYVFDRVTCEVGKMPREVWPVVAAHWSSPKFYRGLRAHLRGVPGSVVEMHEAEPIEGIPVLLVTAGDAEPLGKEGLRRIGSTARQIVAEKSGHWVHLDEPDLVLEAIRGMIEEVRSHAFEDVERISAASSKGG
jgi:pimeloyl-ACP methyl ester carboxylesterase